MQDSDGEASKNDESEVVDLDQPGDRRALRILLDEVKEHSPEFATRRGAIKALGGGAAAGALFGGGYGARTVAAQPTGDEGSIGTSGDRVEVWASEMDANSIDTGSVSTNVGHEAQRFIYKDGSDAVVVDRDGNELQRGTNHGTVIQAAMLNLNPGYFYITAGTYTLDEQLDLGGMLEGEDPDRVTLKIGDGVNPDSVIRLYQGSTVRGVTIDGNQANNTSGYGFYANATSDVKVLNCTLQNTPDFHIQFNGTVDDALIKNNTILGYGYGIRAAQGDNVKIVDNTLDGESNGSPLVFLTALNDSKASGNTVRNSAATNYVVASGGGAGVTISENTLLAPPDLGITVGVDMTDVTVTGNTVRNSAGVGVTVDTVSGGGTVRDSNVTVTGNTLIGDGTSNATHGVNVQNDKFVTVTGNTIHGFERGIAGNATSEDAEHYTFVGNTIEDCSTYGIAMVADGSCIGDNTITGCADGIRVTGDEIAVNGNTVVDNSGTGILVSGTDDLIDGCIALRNSTANLDTSGATTPTTGDNITS